MITIVKQIASNKLLPAFNHQNYTLNSTMNGQCNFRYLTDVYVNGVFRFRLKTFPDPQTGFGFIQIGRVIEDYINNYIPSDGSTGVSKIPTTTPGPYLEVYCKFGEEYDSTTTCTGKVNQYANLATSNTYRVFNAAVDYEDYPSYNPSVYTIGTQSSTTSKFLTLAPREQDVYYNDSVNLTFYSLSKPANLEVKLYNSAGVYDTLYIAGTGSGAGLYNVSCGPYDILKKSYALTLFPNLYYATASVITCDTTKYEVKLVNSATQSVSETFTFNLKPTKDFRTRVGWTGQYGNPERYTFFHRNRKTYNIQRSEYQKNMFRNIGNEWTYQVGDTGRTSLYNKSQESHVVSTFARKEDSEFMTSLWRSTNAWIEKQPRIFTFRAFNQAGKSIFQVEPGLDLKVGDSFWSISSLYPLQTVFTIVAVDGVFIDCDVPATSQGFSTGVVIESYVRLPIMVTDQSVEVSQRTNRPVTYTLAYDMAFEKNTIKS